MGWNILLVNTKTLVLIVVLTLFLILGFLVLLIEVKMRKDKKVMFTQEVENKRITALKKNLNGAKTIQEKLGVIDKQAKNLFSERFGFGSKRTYSELEKIFEERKMYEYSSLCRMMFGAYYSQDNVDEKKIKELLIVLIRLIRETKNYLDSEKYDVNKLVEDKEVKEVKKEKEPVLLRINKGLLFQKQVSLKKKQDLFKEKQVILSQREKELAKKEKQNKQLLLQIDQRLKEQENKIKEQEILQEKIEEKLKMSQQNDVELNKKNEAEIKKVEKTNENTNNAYWREDIDVKPLVGKDWLKKHKTRRKKNR